MNTLPVNAVTRRKFLNGMGCLAAASLVPLRLSAATAKVGDRLPDLTKMGLEGSLPSTEGKVVHLDFWASWCVPCKESFPVLEELHEQYASKGYVLIGISVDEDKADMDRFLKQHKAGFPIVRDAKEKLAFTLRPPGMPTSVFVSPDGIIHSIHSKFEGASTKRTYVSVIEELLKRVK